MYDQRGDPMKTPTTPSTPHFSLFESSPTHSPQNAGQHEPLAAIVTTHLARPSQASPSSSFPAPSRSNTNSSDGTMTTPTGHQIPIIRPLPLRPATGHRANSSGNINLHRINKPSLQQHYHHHGQQSYRRRSRSLSPPCSPLPETDVSLQSSSEQQQMAPPRLLPSSLLIPRIITVSPDSPRLQTRLSSTQLAYQHAVTHLSTRLVPLISITTGESHPYFPDSILQYKLLTHSQLDELARYYHQVVPAVRETGQYPIRIPAWVRNTPGSDLAGDEMNAAATVDVVDLETKRRRWGRFLGLRGCESPIKEGRTTTMVEEEEEERRKMGERLEKEWQREMQRRREEERLRAKAEGWRYRW